MSENKPGADSTEEQNTENPGGSGEGQGEEQDLDDSWLASQDAKTQAYVKKLRKEAAGHRKQSQTLKNNLETLNERFSNFEGGLKQVLGIETGEDGEDIDPRQHLEMMQAQNEQAVIHSAILESAIENGIGREHVGYYKYLILERASQLEEGEELSEDDYSDILSQVRAVNGGGGGGAGKTSITNKPQNPDSKSSVSLDQFAKMTVSQKSELYQKDPNLYTQLMQEARSNRRL